MSEQTKTKEHPPCIKRMIKFDISELSIVMQQGNIKNGTLGGLTTALNRIKQSEKWN